MPVESRSRSALQTGDKVRCRFIVARNQPDLWHDLTRDFGGSEGIQVIRDRRQGERRQRVQAYKPERRWAARRCRLGIDQDLRYRSFVIVYRQQGVLSR